MILIKIFFCFFLFFFSLVANSISLVDKLNLFFQKEYSLEKNSTKVVIHTALKKNMHCKNPLFLIFNHAHSFGLMNILMTCDKLKQYLQVDLQVIGKYIVSNKFIPKGSKIKESDIKFMIGSLNSLPYHTYLNEKDVINTVLTSDVLPLQPITSFMTHPFWVVKTNQIVTVFIDGVNFKVTTKGQALNNACYNQNVRVKINSNNIITGIVNNIGEIRINL